MTDVNRQAKPKDAARPSDPERALPGRSSGRVLARELDRRPRRANRTRSPDDDDPDVNTLFSTVQIE